jgi:hypothetical protein
MNELAISLAPTLGSNPEIAQPVYKTIKTHLTSRANPTSTSDNKQKEHAQ